MIEFVDKHPMTETGVQVGEDALRYGRVLRLTGLPSVTSHFATVPICLNPLYFN